MIDYGLTIVRLPRTVRQRKIAEFVLDLDTIGEQKKGALPMPTNIILDEFPTLGRTCYPTLANRIHQAPPLFVTQVANL